MSHLVTIQTEVRDVEALRLACRRLGCKEPIHGKAELYSGVVEGLIVSLPGWRYPICCQPAEGNILFDHFGGRWGDPKELDRLLQAYAVEKTRLEARKKGYTTTERVLADGSIQLTLSNGGV